MTPAADLTNGLANAYMRNMLHYTIASPTSLTSRTIEYEVSQIHVSLSSSQIFSPTTGSFPTRSLHYRLSVWGFSTLPEVTRFFWRCGSYLGAKNTFLRIGIRSIAGDGLITIHHAYGVPEARAQSERNPSSCAVPFGFPPALAGGDGEMGKNQAYKAMQRSRVGSSSGAPGDADAPEDGMVGPLPPPSYPHLLTDL
jgi:hypothetical protein